MATMKRRVIYVSDDEWATWQRESRMTDRSVSEFIRSHLVGYVRAAQDDAPVALVDVPVIDGVATLPDGRSVKSGSDVVRVPILRGGFNTKPFTPVPKHRK